MWPDRRFARTGTTRILRMRVRPTGITARAGLRVECLSAPARGSTGSMAAAASTVVLALAAASTADTHVEATEVASIAVAASTAADTGKGLHAWSACNDLLGRAQFPVQSYRPER